MKASNYSLRAQDLVNPTLESYTSNVGLSPIPCNLILTQTHICWELQRLFMEIKIKFP